MPNEFDDFLARAEAVSPSRRENMVWKFMQRVKWRGGTPLGQDSTLVFLALGKQPFLVTGMMNGWRSQPMQRLAGTELQYIHYTVPPDARIEYTLTDAHGNHFRDPLNVHTGPQGRSVARMPLYRLPPEFTHAKGVPAGTLDTLVIDSEFLGYSRTVFVYLPPAAPRDTPPNLLICGDGYGALIAGHLPEQLDNLLAEGRITPTVAAMVAADRQRRTWEYSANRAYREFLAAELIPMMRDRYGVSHNREDAAIFGVSFGGLMAADFVLHHPELIANLAAFSPALKTERTRLIHLWQMSPPHGIRVFCTIGRFELGYSSETLEWLEVLRDEGTEVVYHTPSDGHSWGHWRGEIAPMLEMFFPARKTANDSTTVR